jgi:hypothetical protein
LKLWAFGTSPAGLALPETKFWALTVREFNALQAVLLRSLGVEVHTPDEWRQKEVNEAYIREQWVKARQKVFGGANA